MSNFIRTSISLPNNLFIKIKNYNINMSKICQEALEKKIKVEEKKNNKNHSLSKLKKIYYQKGYETGHLKTNNFSKHELRISLSTLKGEGRYSVWNIVDRIDDVFEKNFDTKIFDNHFYTYDSGWILKDATILESPEYSWFTIDKPGDLTIQDFRAEAFFEYKHGFTMGLCNIQKSIDPIKSNLVISKSKLTNNKINKKQAIEIVGKETNILLNNQNTIFSNQNKANDLWWFEPTYKKLESNFFLILHDAKNRDLFLFNISEKETLTKKLFRDRTEKGRVSIVIDSKDTFNFMDKSAGGSNVKFAKYLIKTLKY